FYECGNLTSVTIPASVERIGSSAFSGYNNLNTVTYGGTKEEWERIEKGSDIFLGTNGTKITDKDGNTFAVNANGEITNN
ncbi:MAG: leucine-rich repeat domain-containing protein, partial [Treponemataceae bacterium]|nr:leucine-rich repeat domain-containing protein [Treponemataceae bacterium]